MNPKTVQTHKQNHLSLFSFFSFANFLFENHKTWTQKKITFDRGHNIISWSQLCFNKSHASPFQIQSLFKHFVFILPRIRTLKGGSRIISVLSSNNSLHVGHFA